MIYATISPLCAFLTHFVRSAVACSWMVLFWVHQLVWQRVHRRPQFSFISDHPCFFQSCALSFKVLKVCYICQLKGIRVQMNVANTIVTEMVQV